MDLEENEVMFFLCGRGRAVIVLGFGGGRRMSARKGQCFDDSESKESKPTDD